MGKRVLSSVVVLVFFTMVIVGTIQAADDTQKVEQLRQLVAEQSVLIKKLHGDFHMLKVDLPYNFVKRIIHSQKCVMELNDNSKSIKSILGQVEHIDSVSTGEFIDGQMTAAQLTKWITERSGCPESKYEALEKMLPYVTDLTPFNLDILVYAVSTDKEYKWDRKAVVDLGEKMMAEKNAE